MFEQRAIDIAKEFLNRKVSSNFKRYRLDDYNFIISQTSFLPDKSSTTQRLYHIINGIQEVPKCYCGKDLSWYHTENTVNQVGLVNRYSQFCSLKCSIKDPTTRDKRNKTMNERYGVSNFTQAANFNEKRKKTSLKKYGVEWATQLPETQNKIKSTMKERYGIENYTQSQDYKSKTVETCKRLYGVEHSSQTRLSKEAYTLLNDKDWLIQKHHTDQLTVTAISELLCCDTTTIVEYLKKNNIEMKRYHGSQGERELFEYIKMLVPNTTIISGDRRILQGKELDVFIPEYKLAFEYCGLYWHSEARWRIHPGYHYDKMIECKNQGIRLITIFEDEWKDSQECVKSKIKKLLHKDESPIIYARKTKIKSISNSSAEDFLNTYHIQQNGPGSLKLGLYYKDCLVAVGLFIVKNDRLILNRYATSCVVVGGCSKIISAAIKQSGKDIVESFADRRWSEGDMYNKIGFALVKELPPDYYYVVDNKRKHKFGFRHKHLKNKLAEYDSSLSEVENCHKNGLFRIWNCGLLKYEYRKENI